jgi:hypothetical protein
MKRALLLLIAALFLGIFVLSSNTTWMKELTKYRYSLASKVPSDKYRFGDLYGFSYLRPYKVRGLFPEDLRRYYVKNRPVTGVELYGIVDSYLWSFVPNDSLFRHADAYRATRWDYTAKQYYLNPAKRNVLLLEMVERRVRYTAPDTANFYKHLSFVDNAGKETVNEIYPTNWWQSHVFNSNIEQNLEFNLFEYPIFTPFKEAKAWLNYQVFNRTSKDVVVSKTRRQLYYQQTVDSTESNSSFRHLRTGEVDTMVAGLNQVYKHYRKAGFAEVYLAIMPNPVTVLEPQLGRYNELIPRLQRNAKLQMPVIDVYSKLKALRRKPIYQISDTHWDKAGLLAAGIAQIDSVLAKQSVSTLAK